MFHGTATKALCKDAAPLGCVRVGRGKAAVSSVHQIGGGPVAVAVVDHADPIAVLATWAAATLIVPPGHPRAGYPMVLSPFAVAWLRASWDAHESALSTARKNVKIRNRGDPRAWVFGAVRCKRPGMARRGRQSRQRQGGLIAAASGKDIAAASGLDVKVRRSPYPGVIESSTGKSRHPESADRTAGHASGYDLVIVDETGLFPIARA